MWDIETGTCLQTLEGHNHRLQRLTFSPDGEILASGSYDQAILIWDVASGECLQSLKTNKPYHGMNITGVSGITSAQKLTLKALGAIERED